MSQFAVILPAAGQSSRFGDSKQKKIYSELLGRAVWLRAIEPFINREDVSQMILAIAPEDRELFERRYRANVAFMNIKVIEGGKERSDTIARALEFVDPQCEYVAIHDAARPCLSTELVDAVFAAARQHGAALLAVPVADTIKRVNTDQLITETISREGLYLAQTPQVFLRSLLFKAYAQRSRVTTQSHRRLSARRSDWDIAVPSWRAHRSISRSRNRSISNWPRRSCRCSRSPAAIRRAIPIRTSKRCGTNCRG